MLVLKQLSLTLVQSNGIDGCLQRIREADITYILNFDGYVGKSVAMDIGYALGLGKSVYRVRSD